MRGQFGPEKVGWFPRFSKATFLFPFRNKLCGEKYFVPIFFVTKKYVTEKIVTTFFYFTFFWIIGPKHPNANSE